MIKNYEKEKNKMTNILKPGLGELLRHLSEMFDQGSEAHYRRSNVPIKSRYTPVLRALAKQDEQTVKEITAQLQITQGAVSQTIRLMETDGLIKRKPGTSDARETIIKLTKEGQSLTGILKEHWRARFAAIEGLENELAIPIRNHLEIIAAALEKKGFAERIDETYKKKNQNKNTKGK